MASLAAHAAYSHNFAAVPLMPVVVVAEIAVVVAVQSFVGERKAGIGQTLLERFVLTCPDGRPGVPAN